MTRRALLFLTSTIPFLRSQTQKEALSTEPRDWTCPMDPDVHMEAPGKCPRCGMRLVLKVPDRVEYPIEITVESKAVKPGEEATVIIRVLNPTGGVIRDFELVHERLMHLFLVSEDLSFFAHLHPVAQEDGSFRLPVRLPQSGMYRMLADYYPSGAVPQLAVDTLYVRGTSHAAHLAPSLSPQQSENVAASLRFEPDQPTAGLLTRLVYRLDPAEGLEPYLGAWGHMLIVSEDLIDLIHLHPFLANGSSVQFDVIFPRPGAYKIWTQFQRKSVVNTIAFSVRVAEL